MVELHDFILFVLDEEAEETLWEVWLNKDMGTSFDKAKKNKLVKLRKRKIKTKSKDEEKEAIEFASRFITNINPTEEGGDS